MARTLQIVFFSLILSFNLKSQITGIKILGDTCNSLTLEMQALGTSSSPYFSWNFGDPLSGTNDTTTVFGSSVDPDPTHIFTSIGTYTVCVTFQEPGFPPETVCRVISIGLCCQGIIIPNDSCLQNNIGFTLNTATTVGTINTISWNFGDPGSGASNVSSAVTPVHSFSSAGTYIITAIVNASCGTFTTTATANIVNCTPPAPCVGNISALDTCLANGTDFSINSVYPTSAVSWNFGNPASGSSNSSTSISPSHIFSATGTYIITANVTSTCGTYVATNTVTVINCSPPVPCTGTISSTGNCLSTGTVFGINSTSATVSVNWSFGDPASGANNTSALLAPQHIFSSIGVYTITANINAACGTYVTTTTVTVINCTPPPPCIGVINTTGNCLAVGTVFSVNSTSPVNVISWNFGDPTSGAGNTSSLLNPTHIFSAAGTYTVTASVAATCGSYTINNIITITTCPTSTNCVGNILFSDSCFIEGTGFSIGSSFSVNSVSWHFGDSDSSQSNSTMLNPTHVYPETGLYTVQAIVNLSCGTDTIYRTLQVVNCDCELYVPNVFTPNNDGINDNYLPQSVCVPDEYELYIYNRWGELIFKTNTFNEKWDGKYKDKDCSVGVYSYILKYRFSGEVQEAKYGCLTLLR